MVATAKGCPGSARGSGADDRPMPPGARAPAPRTGRTRRPDRPDPPTLRPADIGRSRGELARRDTRPAPQGLSLARLVRKDGFRLLRLLKCSTLRLKVLRP